MEQEVYIVLLNGMPLSTFIAYYLIGIGGVLIFFLSNLHTAITTDPNTPNTWSWKAFIKGGIRLTLALITLAFSIVYFKEMAPFLFNIAPDLITENDTIVNINGFSSLLMGIGIDHICKGLISMTYGGAKLIKKQ